MFLMAHEAFHYLRKTRQVQGRHGEIEADAFALKTLEQYRHGSSIAALNQRKVDPSKEKGIRLFVPYPR
jgi:hypothetical protein